MPSKKSTESLASTWKQRWSLADSNQNKLRKRVSQYYDAFYAEVKQQAAPWRSRPFVPIMSRQIWSLVSKLVALDPGFTAKVRDPGDLDNNDAQVKAEKINQRLRYDWHNPELDDAMPNKLLPGLIDGFVAGTGIWKVPYKTYQKMRKERVFDEFGQIDLEKEKVITKLVGCNDLIPVNFFNVRVSPDAEHNLYNAPWIIIDDEKSLASLKKTSDEKGGIYKNLDLVSTQRKSTDVQGYNQSRNKVLSIQDNLDKTVDMVVIHECYEGDMMYTFADGKNKDEGWVLIREQKNPYWHMKYPLLKFTPKPRPFSFWGESFYDTTYRLAMIYNDVFAQYLDGNNLANAPMLIHEERSTVNPYVLEPAGEITYRGTEKPELFKFPSPDAGGLQTTISLLEQGIEGVTVSNYATGLASSSTDKTKGTATGIMRLQEAAGDILSFYKKQYRQVLIQLGQFWLSNNQQFQIQDMNVQTAEGPTTVSPVDLQGEIDVDITEASMNPQTDEEMQQGFMGFLAQLMQLKQASDAQTMTTGLPGINLDYSKLVTELSEKFKMSNAQSILIPAEQVAQTSAGAAAPADGKEKAPIEHINYKDAPPSVKAQMEEAAGMTPAPEHEAEAVLNAAQIEAQVAQAKSQAEDPTGLDHHVMQMATTQALTPKEESGGTVGSKARRTEK